MNLIDLYNIIDVRSTPDFQDWTLNAYRSQNVTRFLNREIINQSIGLSQCLVSQQELNKLFTIFSVVDSGLTNHCGFEVRLNDDPTVDFQTWVKGNIDEYLPNKWKISPEWKLISKWVSNTTISFGSAPCYWLEFDATNASIFYYPNNTWDKFCTEDLSYIHHTLKCFQYTNDHIDYVSSLIEDVEHYGGTLEAAAVMVSRTPKDCSRLVISIPQDNIYTFFDKHNLDNSVLHTVWQNGDMLALDINGKTISKRIGLEIRDKVFSRLDLLCNFVRQDKVDAIEKWLSCQSPVFLRYLNNIKIDTINGNVMVIKAYLGTIII